MNKLLINVCGPNGAGKSTFTKTVLARLDLPVIDPDRFSSQGINEIAAAKMAIRLANEYLRNDISFIRESTLSSNYDLRLMNQARESGYRIILIYLSLPSSEISWQRVTRRVINGGHAIPEETVRRRFSRSLKNLARVTDKVDSVFIIDNSRLNYAEEGSHPLSGLLENIVEKTEGGSGRKL